jgi:predicted permease
MWSDLKFRLRALFRRGVMERELDDELRFHLEREIEKHMRARHTRAEAERRAKLEFGGVDRIKDETRDVRGVGWIDAVMQDVRYGWRVLRARPGFTGAVVLTLGLGVGANTAMFGVVDRLLFRPPAFLLSPERVHRVYVHYLWNGESRQDRILTYRTYRDLSAQTSSFDAQAAFAYRDLAIGSGEDTRMQVVAAVTASLFDFFDARPVLGRFYTAQEDSPPVGERVAVLGYGYWQAAFGGRADVLGRQLFVGAAVYTVIGVAPRDFVGITEGAAPAVFVPVTAAGYARTPDYADNYGWSWLEVIMRRKPDVGFALASNDIDHAYDLSWDREREQAGNRWPSASESRTRGEIAPVHLGHGPDAGPEARIILWVMGVAGVVLLIACANVVNLLLARAVHRRREIALRLALGVSHRRLLQQLLVETLLIALLGGAVGLAAAQWGGRTLRALFLRAEDVGAVATDARTLFFTTAITLGLALLTGFVPALQALRVDVASSLKAGNRDSAYRASWLRTGLLLFQAALSVVLLVGAGLFVRSLLNVRSVHLGYDVTPTVLVDGELRDVRLTAPEQNALADRLLAAALTVPGVRNATVMASVPFAGSEARGAPFVPGVDSVARLGRFILQSAGPDYFQTVGTRIVRGRAFTVHDGANAQPIIIVSEAMAAALWPGEDPIGKQLRIGGDSLPMRTVVGVAENVRARQLAGAGEFWYYLPQAQFRAHHGTSRPTLFVRVDSRAEGYVASLRQRLQREMPGKAYVSAAPLRDVIAPQYRAWQFGATMFVAFGALALILAAVGLYSVCAYAVAQRTRELGLRIALGASLGDVVSLIARQGALFALAGIGVGSAVALYVARWVQPLLFSASARDPVIYAAVAFTLLAVSVIATVRPALRATRVDPTIALRAE